MSSPLAPQLEPFGMRFAARPVSDPFSIEGVVYDPDLQIAVTACGKLWAHTAGGESSTNTNSDSQNDEGTDFY
ncbi:putative ATP-grasp-modified RiPP [Peterkaempfera bronchialis]|uniref:putative ATP-grasp-modified RiPP n=1 Tax=Peterkaempfera bronchialis TaxID=2126346 RepID=UPI003C2EAEC3